LTNPDSLRRYYGPQFAGWDSTGADSAAVNYQNLVSGADYLFCVVGFDEAGAYSARFALGGNMIWMHFLEGLGVPQAANGPRLGPPHPNPARNSTSMDIALPRETPLTIVVFDAAGRRVRTLTAGP